MSEPFAPNKPEVMLTVTISGREAHLLKVLRKYEFGKIIVHKLNGLLVRVEPTESHLLTEEEGMDLANE